MGSFVTSMPVVKVVGREPRTFVDDLAVEEPFEIRLAWRPRRAGAAGGVGRSLQPVERSLSITMRTPGHDVELALGFLVSEGVVRSRGDVADAAHVLASAGEEGASNVVRVELSGGEPEDLARLERHVYTTSSCGVCGKSSLAAVRTAAHAPIAAGALRLAPETIHALPDRLREAQAVFGRTGGLHAAGLFDGDGQLLFAREDVGRHNAVDKVVGAALLGERLPLTDHVLVVSGRASFELVQKAAMAGAPVLAAVGAPSSLAVDLAREESMTIIGFVRDGRFNVYAGHDRVEGLAP